MRLFNLMILLFLLFIPLVSNAQIKKLKPKTYCIYGDCKDGRGMQVLQNGVKIRGKGKSYNYHLFIADFEKGKKQGDVISLKFGADHPQRWNNNLESALHVKDPFELLGKFKSVTSIEQLQYKDDKLLEGKVLWFPYHNTIYGINNRWGSASLGYLNKGIANELVDKDDKIEYVIFYSDLSLSGESDENRTYRNDSMFVKLKGGYYTNKKTYDTLADGKIELKDELHLYEMNGVKQFYYKEGDLPWIISNIEDGETVSAQRRIYFENNNISYSEKPCDLFSFPEDQENYKEMQINDSTHYKGGTNSKTGKPHGFGIMTTVRSEPKFTANFSYKNYIYKDKVVYSGYFVNGKKSCVGYEQRFRVSYEPQPDGSLEKKNESEYAIRFGDYDNDRLNYGWTIPTKDMVHVYGFKGYQPNEKSVFKGRYNTASSSVFPYNGVHYHSKNLIHQGGYQLKQYESGFFNEYGRLVSGKRYNHKGGFSQVSEGKVSSNPTAKAYNLMTNDVVKVNGQNKMVKYSDANYVYFTDGSKIKGTEQVEVLPKSARNAFMCRCPDCDGKGYIVTKNIRTSTDTYNKQEYLGSGLVATYKVTETRSKTDIENDRCKTCYGEGKYICR